MSATRRCPTCGRPGRRISRVRVAFAEFRVAARGRTVTLARDSVTLIYRCASDHRWTVSSPHAQQHRRGGHLVHVDSGGTR